MNGFAPGALRSQINPHAFLGMEITRHALGAVLLEPQPAIHMSDAAFEPVEHVIARHAAQLDLAAAPSAGERLFRNGVGCGIKDSADGADVTAATTMAGFGQRVFARIVQMRQPIDIALRNLVAPIGPSRTNKSGG